MFTLIRHSTLRNYDTIDDNNKKIHWCVDCGVETFRNKFKPSCSYDTFIMVNTDLGFKNQISKSIQSVEIVPPKQKYDSLHSLTLTHILKKTALHCICLCINGKTCIYIYIYIYIDLL